MDTMCRLCMERSSVGMEPIFTSVMGHSLASKIAGVTQLMLYEGDGLPANVCQRCIFKLDIADNFIQKCVFSDNTIKAMQSTEITYRPPPSHDENGGKRQLVNNHSVIEKELDARRATSPLRFELDVESPKDGTDILPEAATQTFTFEETVQSHSPGAGDADIGLFEEMDHASTEHNSVYNLESGQASQTNGTEMKSMTGNDESNASARHSCRICSRMFDSPLGLRNHSVSHLGKRRRMFPCDFCPRKFSRLTDLNVHELRTHCRRILAGPFECDICQKTFRDKKTLKEHILMHFESKSENYTHRDKGSAKKKLKDPMLVLSNDRPHMCVLCDETFKREVTLKSHVEQHCRP